MLEHAGELDASELAALISVEDLGLVVPCQGVLQGLDAEIGAERVRQPPGQNRTTVPVHDRDQIHEPLGHRDIGDVRAPNLVDPIDRQPTEQIGIDLVRGCRLARVRPLKTATSPISRISRWTRLRLTGWPWVASHAAMRRE